jgi:glycosyltransferase involved in cell wall biosynthesis
MGVERNSNVFSDGQIAPFVSVVIPVRNGGSELLQQVHALGNQQSVRSGWELLLVDNGCVDDSCRLALEVANSLGLAARCVPALDAPGINVARNAGIKAAAGNYILLCDADDQVRPNWIEQNVDALATANIVAGRLYLDRLNPRRRICANVEFLGPTFRTSVGTFCHGACLAFRKEVWTQVDFDEGFTGGWDENDFLYRAGLLGYEITSSDCVGIDYRLRPSLRTLARQRFRYGKGEARFREKHGFGESRLRAVVRILKQAKVVVFGVCRNEEFDRIVSLFYEFGYASRVFQRDAIRAKPKNYPSS